MIKQIHIFTLEALLTFLCNPLNLLASLADSTRITVPLGGNAWVKTNAKAKVDSAGLNSWSDKKDTISIYIRTEASGTLKLALRLKVLSRSSSISLIANGKVFTKNFNNQKYQDLSFGSINVLKPGYLKVSFAGLRKGGAVFADISDLLLDGTALAKGAAYVKNNHGNYFYWGHRGPSVHLNYQLPAIVKDRAAWFYNEITVPQGNDLIGSYFMADGFTGGYFGMQVNSAAERHILFSIWSPFTTDDPKSIPDSLKIRLLKKGEKVHAGEFGSEGSGGQSYMNYPWKAGKTYAFLVRAQADSNGKTTVFTGYFKEVGKLEWHLIASFKRPLSGFYLQNLYSFLENFEPGMGDKTRKALYGNQWVADVSGKWYALNTAVFTADATANINYRKDYSGGTSGTAFYLRNCGFFDDFTPARSVLTREVSAAAAHPEIDFTKLP